MKQNRPEKNRDGFNLPSLTKKVDMVLLEYNSI